MKAIDIIICLFLAALLIVMGLAYAGQPHMLVTIGFFILAALSVMNAFAELAKSRKEISRQDWAARLRCDIVAAVKRGDDLSEYADRIIEFLREVEK